YKGRSNEDIIKHYPEIDRNKLEDEIRNRKKELDINTFWKYDEMGNVKISPHRYKFYLENKNYYKYYPVSGENTFTFLKKEGNFIEEISANNIKDKILNILLDKGDVNVYDYMASSKRVFEPSFLSMLDTAEF